MNLMLRNVVLGSTTALLVATAVAQDRRLTVQQYEQQKAAGTLPIDPARMRAILPGPLTSDKVIHKPSAGSPKGGGGGGVCNCWIEPDNSYTQQTTWPLGSQNEDDGAAGPFALPFTFNLYGDTYTDFYLNINGNISFGTAYNTFTAEGFPSAAYVMVAPFWADVQLTGDLVGSIKYKITDHALFVNWTDVGYYAQHYDKRNTFQLIVTDGTDPVIGLGNNVSFCYKDMQWTTGDASQGVDGFGGVPSTTGANRGNGTDFIQFTRNDHDGLDYDGPFGNADGVSWLDYKSFRFTTAVSTQNIPPIINSNFLCDTVEVCMGELVDFNVTFLTPEEDQSIINTSAEAPTIDNFASTVINNGTNATINVQFIPTIADTGFHVVTFTGQDNGADSLESTVSIVLAVYYTPAPPPIITGDTIACEGQGVVLTAGGGYDDYIWTNGYFGPSILVGPGSYMCLATSGNCRLASNEITVYGLPNPDPDITGTLFSCGGIPATLGTDEDYAQYLWSNGGTDENITVGTGDYFVTVTDDNGCFANSDTVSVLSANDPQAGISSDSPSSVFPGAIVVFTNTSTIDGGTIVSVIWTIGDTTLGTGTTLTQLFDTPGSYPITITVTTADGCTGSFTYTQIVMPTEIQVPNVFSPNGDGKNDFLEFPGVEYYPNSRLSVFNRWGQEIFTSASYKNTWRAADVAEGTYYYVLKLENGKEYTGHVTLLR
ncbi:MAG: gliding motility-associated C-terminal domain-containing protein [Flavobacteriales bacterium]|nr:gliding motility-associated C-terminal domain-containing protein [Flavobacteriales bacterium]